jgi:hypothetical protein
MTTPSSCPAHKRNATKQERTRTVWPTDPSPKSTCTLRPPSPPSLHPHSPSQKSSFLQSTNVKTGPGNATQTHPPTSHPQLILVLHPPTPGRPTPSSRTHRRTRPSQPSPPRKVPPPHPRSRHPLLLRIAQSLCPRPTLLSILPHFTPLAPHTRLCPAESENPSPSPPL